MMNDYEAENPFEEEETKNPFEDEDDEEAIVQKGTKPPQLPKKDKGPKLPKKEKVTSLPRLPKKDPALSPASVIAELNTPLEMTEEGLRRKEQELKRREEDLARKEGNMISKEEELEKIAPKAKNWPRCRPIIYHNIEEEIPQDDKPLVKRAYYLWFFTVWCFFWNFFTILADLIVNANGGAVASLILSIVYFIFLVPLSFLFYRLLYNATRKRKSLSWLLFMIIKWIEFLLYGWMALGISGWGGGGIFLMISLFQANKVVVGIFSVICFAFWVLDILGHVYLFIHARIRYKRAGGLNKAKEQATTVAGKTLAENPEFAKSALKAAANV